MPSCAPEVLATKGDRKLISSTVFAHYEGSVTSSKLTSGETSWPWTSRHRGAHLFYN